MHPAAIAVSEMNIMKIRDLPSEEGLFDLRISFREQMKVAAARRMKAGVRNRAGGRISVRDRVKELSVPLICISPLQKPMAKLLYHNIAKGRKQMRPESIAAIISTAAV